MGKFALGCWVFAAAAILLALAASKDEEVDLKKRHYLGGTF